MIADPTDGGVLRFVRLDEGTEAGVLHVPGEWTTEFSERPESTSKEGQPLVLECPPSSFAVVRGQTPELERVEVSERIWSRNLVFVDRHVAFLNADRELFCWSLETKSLTRLGRVQHNRRDQLAFRFVAGLGYLFGSSAGSVSLWSKSRDLVVSTRVGKRVATSLFISASVLVCGTDSGELVGLNLRGDG
jgi:hypothetical protein